MLQKTLLLAAKLEQKRGKPVESWPRRRLLLLTALALISRGCGVGTKLLQLDELIDWLSGPLAKVSFKIGLAALAEGSVGLNRLAQDIRLAQQLQVLHAWKQRHRRSKSFIPLKKTFTCSALQPFLTLLDQKRAFLAAQKQRLFAAQVATQKAKNAQLSTHLAALQDGSKAALLAPFLHAWRCLLNFRLVRARTRRRFKAAVLTRWRRCGRVGRIAGIFYGKKVKLRAINRWFCKRFGRNREQALTT